MSKMLAIKECVDCKHFDGLENECEIEEAQIDPLNPIPTWCPLPIPAPKEPEKELDWFGMYQPEKGEK